MKQQLIPLMPEPATVWDWQGIKIVAFENDGDMGWYFRDGADYEPFVWGEIKDGLPCDGVLVDVGSNLGTHSLRAAPLCARVLSVEPNQLNLQCFAASLVENGFRNVVLLPVACGVSDFATVWMHRGFSNAEVSSVQSDNGGIVLGMTLDTLCAEESRVDVLKIDVEGYEMRVLQGALRTIARHKPKIVFEFYPRLMRNWMDRPEDVLRMLMELGYRFKVLGKTTPPYDGPGRLDIPGVLDFYRQRSEIETGYVAYLDIACVHESKT